MHEIGEGKAVAMSYNTAGVDKVHNNDFVCPPVQKKKLFCNENTKAPE